MREPLSLVILGCALSIGCATAAPRVDAPATRAGVTSVGLTSMPDEARPLEVSDTAWHAAPWGGTPLIRLLQGVSAEPGPFRYYYRTPATTSIGAHRHSVDMHIRVVVGRQYILMGPELETAHVQWFDAGTSFVIPANTWHVEWFETNTLVEISGDGPMRTDRATEAMPRHPVATPK